MMNYYRLTKHLDDLHVTEAGPFVARVTGPDDTVIRRHDLWAAEIQMRQEWNRFVGALLANGAKNMFNSLINRLRITRTMAELNALDDRMLADIGLYRSDIAHVARKLSEATTQPMSANTIIAPVNTATDIPADFVAEAANSDEQREAA